MAHWKSYFDNKFVGAWTFEKGPAVVEIEKATPTQVDTPGGKKACIVVSFKGAKLPMMCNVTNSDAIADIAGKVDPTEWGGTKIELYATTCKNKGEIVDCVRVRAPKKANQ